MEHVPDPIKVFQEIDRLLLPREVLILSTPNGNRALLRRKRWGDPSPVLNTCGILMHEASNGYAGGRILRYMYWNMAMNPGWLRQQFVPLLGLGRTLTLIPGKGPDRPERGT